MTDKVIASAINKKFQKLERPLKRAVLKLFRAFPKLKNRQVEVYLVGKEVMDKNVLAFPVPRNFPRPDLRGKKMLGEIYLNPDYIKNEKLELNFMLIHGFLHLLGYDHKKTRDTIIMQKKEATLLQILNLKH